MRAVQGAPLSGLTYLNLHHCGLRKIENLGHLKDLKVRRFLAA